jgi:hypothetical protein
MTESEWLDATDLQPMLAALQAGGTASERKLRLFAAACCRRAGIAPLSDRARAVEAAERYADGLVDRGMLEAARDLALAALDEAERVYQAALASFGNFDWAEEERAAAAAIVACTTAPLWDAIGESGQDYLFIGIKPGLLRDIYGPLPLRNVPLDPMLFSWNNGTVVRLAAAAYEERVLPEGTLDVGRLAVLADALEEAGCNDNDILGHLRKQGGVHVRGCWLVDLLLGRS